MLGLLRKLKGKAPGGTGQEALPPLEIPASLAGVVEAGYGVARGTAGAVISSLEPREAGAVLEFMARTARRIPLVLEGVAREAAPGSELLVVFDSQEEYYEFVSRFYPEKGEFAFSGGMHLDDGTSSYYVTTLQDLRAIEPVIAHEMTHGFVNHLPLPLWVNEGLAVNTESRLTSGWQPQFTPQELRAKHLRFWGPAEIQEFWSGRSYSRSDDGNLLSYDLGRILVEQLSADWPRFAAFACAAHWSDGGAAAAREHFGTTLGGIASALLERPAEGYEPDPSTWDEPEHEPARPILPS